MPVNMKRSIAKELSDMLCEKGLNRINVRLLADRCGISRQAFYYHFRDLDDVIEWSIDSAAKELCVAASASTSPEEALALYLDALTDRNSLLHRILESPRHLIFESQIIEATGHFLAACPFSREQLDTPLFLDFYAPALFSYARDLDSATHEEHLLTASHLCRLMAPGQ